MRRSVRMRRDRPRGVALIVVLGLISIAMALSYTMMRAQGTTLQIQQNSRRRADARQAALSGLMAGLGHLHQQNWTGAGSTLAGNISLNESYTVQYSTGDARLTPSHVDYADWPYRLTLQITGYAASEEGGATSTHRIRAVARFVPKALSPTPPDWPHMQGFTAYQWTGDAFNVQIPARIEGPIWMQGNLTLCEHYPSTSASRKRYLSDLNAMRAAGRPDYRPFVGPLHWRSIQNSVTLELVTQSLGIPTEAAAERTASNWNHPGALTSYRLYPGGESYQAPRLPQTLENVSISPDPQTNPLGIFVREGSVELRNNVTLTGQLIATEDIVISGNTVRLQAFNLPAISPSGTPVRLPALLAGDDVRAYTGSAASIQGAVLAWDEMEVHEGAESTRFEIQGRVISKKISIGPRNEWNYGQSTWSTLYNLFQWQSNFEHPVKYFPDYITPLGRRPAPKILIAPDAAAHVDHFPRTGEAVYAPAAGDAGLRWELIDFHDEG